MSINRDPPIEKRVFVRAFRQIIYGLIYIYIYRVAGREGGLLSREGKREKRAIFETNCARSMRTRF